MKVWIVWYGGGIIGVYSQEREAEKVKQARNDYAQNTFGTGTRVLKARVEDWDVQDVADWKDL